MSTTASGTLCTNRRFFPEVLKPQPGESRRGRGTHTFAYSDKLTVVRWSDNRDVYAMSTLYSDSLCTVGWQVDGQVKNVPCSDIISDYNTFMGGVDLTDQVIYYYAVGRKTMNGGAEFSGE